MHSANIMNTLRILPRLLLPLLAFAGAVPEGLAKSSLEERREKVRKVRDATLAELYKLHPAAKGRLGKADGYAVFSNIGVNLFFASFAGGSGLVVDRKGGETFMKMGSVGIGLGLGIKDFRAVFIFHDPEKLDAFLAKGWDFSGQADAAAKSDDKGAAAGTAVTVIPGVEIYQITKNGLALQATLQGRKYWRDRDLN